MTLTLEPSSPQSQAAPKAPTPKIVRWYTTAAIVLLNTILLFVVINVICWIGLAVHEARTRPSYLSYSDAWYRSIYPSLPDDEWKEIIRETKARPYAYETYTMYTEGPYQGKYVNVTDQGYRVVPNQGPWPIDPKNFNVFTFGNSTMFGYCVTDAQSIAAYLQEAMQQGTSSQRVCVYNFGRRGYDSTQERILFQQLLRDGARPNLAVFLDGANDFLFSDDSIVGPLKNDPIFVQHGVVDGLMDVWHALPAGKAVQLVLKNHTPQKHDTETDPSAAAGKSIDRYLWNKKAIEAVGNANGVSTVFVFQPEPLFGHPESFKLHEWEDPGDHQTVAGYPLMASYVKTHDVGADFLWLAELQGAQGTGAFLDKWHYSPVFAQQIAGEINKFVLAQKDGPKN
jgi:hypothetical protein